MNRLLGVLVVVLLMVGIIGCTSRETLEPKIPEPEVQKQEIEKQEPAEVETQEPKTPGTEIVEPEIVEPETQIQVLEFWKPEIEQLETKVPEIEESEIEEQETEKSEIQEQEIEESEPKEASWEAESVDLTTWDEQKVYDFIDEVKEYVMEIPYIAPTKEDVVAQYEKYFTPEWSKKIVESLYIWQTDSGWEIPPGDGGYMFWGLRNGSETKDITFDFQEDYIRVRETFEMGMYSAIEYTIGYRGKPVIIDWIIDP